MKTFALATALFLSLTGVSQAKETVTCADGTKWCCDIITNPDGTLSETNCDSGACPGKTSGGDDGGIHASKAFEAGRALSELMSVACDRRTGTCEFATEELEALQRLLPSFAVPKRR